MCIATQPTPAPVIPAAPQQAPQEQDPAIQSAKAVEKKKQQLAAAGNSTLVTGGQGLLDAPTTTGNKTAYGA